MKRLLIISLLLLFIIPGCKKADQTVEIKGIINFFAGEVNLTDKNGIAKKANLGDEIFQGTMIDSIGDKSFAEVYVGDFIIKIMGNTKISAQTLFETGDSSNSEVRFKVEKGSLFSKITKKLDKGSVYEVLTPTATAAVRGTEFMVSQDEKKSNVACLTGLVSVLNNSIVNSKEIILEPNEETDIIPGQDMVKKQIASDKARMLKILTDIKDLRQEIRKKFEDQRDEIRKHVTDQRQKNKEMLDAQREKDKTLAEDQKQRDKKNISDIKDTTKQSADSASDAAKKEMEKTKVDKESAIKEAEEKKKSVKPVIDKEKFKVNKDNFKTNKQ